MSIAAHWLTAAQASKRAVNCLVVLMVLLLASGCVSDGLEKVDRQEAGTANTELGLAYLRQGKTERARETLLRAIELDESIAEAHSGLGLIYLQNGQLDEAAKHYRRALQLKPNDSSNINRYAVLLCQKGEYARAISMLETVMADRGYKTPEIAATNAGICARKAGDLLSARRWLTAALEASPRHGAAIFELAQLNFESGDSATAAELVEQYLELQSIGVAGRRAGLKLGIEVAARSGNAWAADRYASTLRALAAAQPAAER